jgi:hypothetical protein
MEGLAGLTVFPAVLWILGGLIFFLMVLSIAVDSTRIVRRLAARLPF